MKRLLLLLLFLFALPAPAWGWNSDFTVHTSGSGAPVVLIVGGIQGDEPGGFSAATLLATQYRFTRGSVLVVPNLNFPSIVERSRGLHGDMNRKFDRLDEKDPEYARVRRIQSLITLPEVGMVLNLHDGSGLYRPTYESPGRNPARWGQSVIIDMAELSGCPQGNLEERAMSVIGEVNTRLLQKHHVYHLKNTRTDEGGGDVEMRKALTWFAVRHGKPAYGLEVSKDFTVVGRAYYHLQTVEAFLRLAGLEYERSFPLTFAGVREALQSDISVAFAGERIRLPLENVRPRLSGYIPLPRDPYAELSVSKPILAVLGNAQEMRIHYGNRLLTRFKPEWHDRLSPVPEFTVVADGRTRTVRPGEIVPVQDFFRAEKIEGYRINAIGADKGRDESGIPLRKKDFYPEYSMDQNKTIFRVEAYHGDDFAGMFLVCFGCGTMSAQRELLPGVSGPESDFGK